MPEQCCEAFPDGLQVVEVKQRALMNILSRYPGAFDVFRELIQNADDADAHNIEVHFRLEDQAETSEFASTAFDVSKVNVCKWIIKNDGKAFTLKDWERLGRIADGNDNSTKVGAFGVGFYSVLSKSDRPLVTSDGKSLQFFRGSDGELWMRSIDCHSADSWTSVELELRDPEPMPVLTDLARFLVSSVAFLANIESISVYIEGYSESLMCIRKAPSKSVDSVSLPPHLARTTKSKTLTIESIQRTVQRITIDAKDWVFTSSSTSSSSLVDVPDTVPEQPAPPAGGDDHPTRTSHPILDENAITHDLYTATVRVDLHPDSEMRRGVESTIKSLPSSFKCKALYFNSQQHDFLTSISPHLPKAKHLAHIVSGPQGIFSETNSGRLFIGQSTNQTTGIGLHLSGHFLSTMERGSIDLSNGQIAAWNEEALRVSGFLARIIYEEEMGSAKFKDDLATEVGLYTMNRFAFGSASPHGGVSQILEDAFFSCCSHPKSPFPVVSDIGISCLSNSQFRKSHKDLSFIKKCRVLHEKVESRQLSQIIDRYKIPTFKYGDIIQEFEAGVPPDTLKVFFEWWEVASKNTPQTESAKSAREKFCKEFPSRGVLRSTHGPPVEIVLKNIKYFTFLPLPDDFSPPDTIRIEVTSGLPTKANVECFGWSQLPLLHWLEYACTRARRLPVQENSRKNLDAGYRVLRVLVQFALIENLSQEHWGQVAELMQSLECIPTTVGRNSPENSYFEEANIVGNLPVVEEGVFLDIPMTLVAVEKGFEHRTASSDHVRKVLTRIGVRAMMHWDDLVGRLEVAASAQSNDRFLYYLAHSRPWERLNGLKGRRIFFSETHGRECAAKLYLPDDEMRKLGLPILALPSNSSIVGLLSGWEPSAIRQVIDFLGIQYYPSLNNIISLAASDEMGIRRFALQYFLLNLESKYDAYKSDNFANVAFIPTKCGSLARPNEVLGSAVWEKLGFKQISPASRRDLSRLGIKDDPSVDTVVEYLKTPSRTLPDIPTASLWFEHLYLHGKLPTPKLRDQLSTMSFVPVKKSDSSSSSISFEYISPKECFIGQTGIKDHYRDIFPFVDFGSDGNNFLDSCCAKKSPDASDIARKIMQDPQKYLAALGNDTNLYLGDLRSIASQLDSVSEEDKRAMKKAQMFLAFRTNKDNTKLSRLLRADQVVIVDWGSRDFGDNVFVPPKDDLLERMYCEMGSAFLGMFVRHDITPIGHKANCDPPFTHEQVISRIRCFMYQRDASRKADVSFYDEESTDKLRVSACKSLTLKKVFAPPCGILPPTESRRTIETVPVQMKAGLALDESDESRTLWMVKDSRDSEGLHKGIAVALCHVLLKTYSPSDVLLLASLFAKGDERIEEYYGNEMMRKFTCVPNTKVMPKKRVKIELALAPFFAKAVGLVGIPSKPGFFRIVGESTAPLEEAMSKAIGSWGHDTGHSPDFSLPTRARPSIKKHSGHCKQAHTIRLKEKENSCGIRFFVARDAQCQHPPPLALEEFVELVSTLARVFGQEASRTCFIFWKDTDEDLMAFNRDQMYIFLNLAHYSRFSRDDLDRKKVITEWYLIMAHEIAHNVTLDHDEYHGSISSKIAVTYLPALYQHFSSVFCGEHGANTLPIC